MQIRAIIEAAADLIKQGYDVKPEIMIPQVSMASELNSVKQNLERISQEMMKNSGVHVKYSFGTMMEVVRSCLTASKIAEYVEFFSFGTNDLTQGTFSFSREDAENTVFLPQDILSREYLHSTHLRRWTKKELED